MIVNQWMIWMKWRFPSKLSGTNVRYETHMFQRCFRHVSSIFLSKCPGGSSFKALGRAPGGAPGSSTTVSPKAPQWTNPNHFADGNTQEEQSRLRGLDGTRGNLKFCCCSMLMLSMLLHPQILFVFLRSFHGFQWFVMVYTWSIWSIDVQGVPQSLIKHLQYVKYVALSIVGPFDGF